MTRTELIAHAMLTELRLRRAHVDATGDIVSVSITVRLQDGGNRVRSVEYSDQRIVAKRGGTADE